MKSNRVVPRLVKVVSLALVTLHFGLTLLYVMPLNPVKAILSYPLALTIGTYFPQNWSLFAPNPVSENQAILVRCLNHEEALAAASGGLPTAGWRDLTTPLIERHQTQRFAAYERVHRPAGNAARDVLGVSIDMKPWISACKNGDTESCATVEKMLKPRQESATKLLTKIGSSFCLSQHGSYEQVAIRVRRTPGLPWSDRHQKQKPKSVDVPVGLFPIDRSVVPINLYQQGVRS